MLAPLVGRACVTAVRKRANSPTPLTLDANYVRRTDAELKWERARETLTIRAIELRDIDAILAIQSASPEIAQWTLWDYERVVAAKWRDGWPKKAARSSVFWWRAKW